MEKLIDFSSPDIRLVLPLLLKDRTTRKNIIWATDTPPDSGCRFEDEVTMESLNKIQLVPRVQKRLSEQQKRTKKKAEVYTPIWLVKKMADHTEEILNIGNWKQFIKERCLEITCGEAPFITSRYDPTTGERIDIPDRVGILDRKLKAISENLPKELDAHSDPALMWWEYAEYALQSTYAYEWQGDSLLLARTNLYLTFCERFKKFTRKEAADTVKRAAAFIISWNVWQMDGLKDTVPCTNILCKIKDWEIGDEILFRKIKEESDNMPSKKMIDADILLRYLYDRRTKIDAALTVGEQGAAAAGASAGTLSGVIRFVESHCTDCTQNEKPKVVKPSKTISDYLSPEEILTGMAEEFAEGSQAALKLRRALDGSNPTPKPINECMDNLIEECADALLCVEVFLEASYIEHDCFMSRVRPIIEAKRARWLHRLQEKDGSKK